MSSSVQSVFCASYYKEIGIMGCLGPQAPGSGAYPSAPGSWKALPGEAQGQIRYSLHGRPRPGPSGSLYAPRPSTGQAQASSLPGQGPGPGPGPDSLSFVFDSFAFLVFWFWPPWPPSGSSQARPKPRFLAGQNEPRGARLVLCKNTKRTNATEPKRGWRSQKGVSSHRLKCFL